MTSEVTAFLPLFEHDDPDELLVGLLHYCVSDPYAVRLGFLNEPKPLAFARDLLDRGSLEPAGEGCVQLSDCRDPAWVLLTLPRHGRKVTYRTPRRGLERFLASTYDLVPPGQESDHTDWDAVCLALIGEPT